MNLRYLIVPAALAVALAGTGTTAGEEDRNEDREQGHTCSAVALVSDHEVTIELMIHQGTGREAPGVLATIGAGARAGLSVARAAAATASAVLAAVVRTATHTAETPT